jgi:hypothetical protein
LQTQLYTGHDSQVLGWPVLQASQNILYKNLLVFQTDNIMYYETTQLFVHFLRITVDFEIVQRPEFQSAKFVYLPSLKSPSRMIYQYMERPLRGSISIEEIVSGDFGTLFLILLERFEVPNRAGSGLFFILMTFSCLKGLSNEN